MVDSEIKGQGYRVWLDPSTRTVHFEGILRLSTGEYQPIEELLNGILASEPPQLCLSMTDLQFLNSSGINMLYKFAIAVRKKGAPEIRVRAANTIPWQGKSLPNLKKFLPTIAITFD